MYPEIVQDKSTNVKIWHDIEDIADEMSEVESDELSSRELDKIAKKGAETLAKKYHADEELVMTYIWEEYQNRDNVTAGRKKMATGEMSKWDIEEGGEDYEWAQAIEKAAKYLQKLTHNKLIFREMKPFDKYQGPYASMNTGKLWGGSDEDVYFYEMYHGKDKEGFIEDIAEWINSGEYKTASVNSFECPDCGSTVKMKPTGIVKENIEMPLDKQANKTNGEKIMSKEIVSAETFECPDCGSKVLENTGYCVKCKKKVKKANTKPEVNMKKEKVAGIISKTAKALEAGELNNQQAKNIVMKLAEKLEKHGKIHTASALKNIVADGPVETEAAEGDDKVAEGVQKAIQKIYQRRQDFLKIKNQRVKQIYTGLSGPDLLNMKILPFIEMIANTPV